MSSFRALLALGVFSASLQTQALAATMDSISVTGAPPLSGEANGHVRFDGTPIGLDIRAGTVVGLAAFGSLSGEYSIWTSNDMDTGIILGICEAQVYAQDNPWSTQLVLNIFGAQTGLVLPRVFGGLYFEKTWKSVSLRFTPNLTTILTEVRYPFFGVAESMVFGAPWLRLRYKLDDNTSLVLQSNYAPIGISFIF